MAQAVEPNRRASSVTFEVERFETQGRDRMVLSGRWFGLRGRRFVRPTLTMGADGRRQRALADLDHKPWAAEDGELWEAAFPYERDGDELGHIELTVAPDITIALPPPGPGATEQRIRARPRRDDLLDNLRGARRDGRRAAGSVNGADPEPAGRSATRREDGLEAQREAPREPQAPPPVAATGPDGIPARRPTRRRSGQSPELAQHPSPARQEIETLKAELARHARARDHAVRARDQALRERDQIAKERDQALRERERAIAKATKLAETASAARADHRAAAPVVARSRVVTSPAVMWAQRVLAVGVLLIVVLAFAITARVV